MKIYTFTITGFHCGSCAKISEVMLRKVKGVMDVFINTASGDTRVTSQFNILPERLAEPIEKLGYHVTNISYETLS